MQKAQFLKEDYQKIIEGINPNEKPVFGKMNVHQMIEHMDYAFQQASGLLEVKALYNEEITAKSYRFMMSEIPFKDNTPNVLLPEEPLAPKHANIQESISALRKSIENFFTQFENNPEKRNLNPFFGNLNFEEWIQLLHKHAQHHLRQFNK